MSGATSFDAKPMLEKSCVPFISTSAIEAHATTLLNTACPRLRDIPGAVPIEEIAESSLGLELEYQCLAPDGSILGMTIFEDGPVTVYEGFNGRIRRKILPISRGTIILDNGLICGSKVQERRCRFTLAHEIGHWLLHQQIINSSAQQLPVMNESDTKRMEWQADQFASSLLLPKSAVCRMARAWLTENGLNIPRFNRAYDQDMLTVCNRFITDVSDRFDVSRQATQIRLFHLGFLTQNTSLK